MSLDPISPLLSQGVLGVVCVLLLLLGRVIFSKIEEAHTRELTAKDQAHLRELAAKDSEIAALRADKTALDAAYAEQIRFTRDVVVPAMTRTSDIAHEYVDLLSQQARRAIGTGG